MNDIITGAVQISAAQISATQISAAQISAAQTSETSNAGLHTAILALIMVVGTAIALWLLLKYGNRGA